MLQYPLQLSFFNVTFNLSGTVNLINLFISNVVFVVMPNTIILDYCHSIVHYYNANTLSL